MLEVLGYRAIPKDKSYTRIFLRRRRTAIPTCDTQRQCCAKRHV